MAKAFVLADHVAEIQTAYDAMKGSRDREAVYPFLVAVYRAARSLQRASGSVEAARRILYEEVPEREGKPMIRELIDKVSTDSRAQRSKWYRALSYCFQAKVPTNKLRQFMQENGGINGCADLGAK